MYCAAAVDLMRVGTWHRSATQHVCEARTLLPWMCVHALICSVVRWYSASFKNKQRIFIHARLRSTAKASTFGMSTEIQFKLNSTGQSAALALCKTLAQEIQYAVPWSTLTRS
jgi:hypothetical protein